MCLEEGGVTLDGEHANEVPAGGTKYMAFLPLRDLGRPESEEALGLGMDIIGLDVEVEPRSVVNGLERGHQAGKGFRQFDELGLRLVRSGRDAESRGPESGRLIDLRFRGVDENRVDAASMHTQHSMTDRGLPVAHRLSGKSS